MSSFLQKLRSLPQVARSMIFVFWLYSAFQLVTDIFIGAFVLMETGSFIALVVFRWILYVGCLFGFAIFGHIFPGWQRSMKWSYLLGFALYLFAYLILFFLPQSYSSLLLFSFFHGLALGVFWLGVHAHELHFIDDHIRDFYSSVQSAGTSIIKIVIPILSASLIGIAHTTGMGELHYLILVLICIPFVSLPILARMTSFVPHVITKSIVHQTRRATSFYTHAYYIASSLKGDFLLISASFFSLLALKNLINIGVWESLVAVFSILLTLWLAPLRSAKNREHFLLIGFIGLFIAVGSISLTQYSPFFYIGYSLIMVIISPFVGISEHMINLRCMEHSGRETSKYAGMIYREWVLFFGRTIGAGALILATMYFNELTKAKIGLLFVLISTVLVYIFVMKIKRQKISHS